MPLAAMEMDVDETGNDVAPLGFHHDAVRFASRFRKTSVYRMDGLLDEGAVREHFAVDDSHACSLLLSGAVVSPFCLAVNSGRPRPQRTAPFLPPLATRGRAGKLLVALAGASFSATLP